MAARVWGWYMTRKRARGAHAEGAVGGSPRGPGWSPRMALTRVLDVQYRAVVDNEDGVLGGADVAALHDMRVACRRFREAVRFYDGILRPAASRVLVRDIKWLGGVLGKVRDVDVMCRELCRASRLLGARDRKAAAAYHRWLYRRHDRLQQAMLTGLRSRRMTAVRTRMAALTTGAARFWRPDAPGDLGLYAVPVFDRLLRRVLRKGRRLDDQSSDAKLHRLRAACKRLRYAAEFLEDANGRKMGLFARETKRVQDLLGDHQDVVVLLAQVRHDLVSYPDGGPDGIDAGGLRRIERLLLKRQRALRRRYSDVWRRFVSERVQRLSKTLNPVESGGGGVLASSA